MTETQSCHCFQKFDCKYEVTCLGVGLRVSVWVTRSCQGASVQRVKKM